MLSLMFARHNIPDVLALDNGPQFESTKFAKSANQWSFEHVTSSPHYTQSNGKAEYAVSSLSARRMEPPSS